jgi:hypothetical protein
MNPSTLLTTSLLTRMVFSPEENFRDLSGFESQKHHARKKVSQKVAQTSVRQEGTRLEAIKYL